MDIISKINKEYPTWVAKKQLEKHPNADIRRINGMHPNANTVTMEQAALKSITTAKA